MFLRVRPGKKIGLHRFTRKTSVGHGSLQRHWHGHGGRTHWLQVVRVTSPVRHPASLGVPGPGRLGSGLRVYQAAPAGPVARPARASPSQESGWRRGGQARCVAWQPWAPDAGARRVRVRRAETASGPNLNLKAPVRHGMRPPSASSVTVPLALAAVTVTGRSRFGESRPRNCQAAQ